ncbi:MAG: SGNH/GDSL hydrolase family protein, partial [Anaerolineales bacterium]
TLDQIVSRQDCCIERDPDVPVSDLGGLTPRQALLANPPIYFERNLRNIVAIARAHDANVMLMTFAVNPNEWGIGSAPYYLEATLEHNAIIERLGTELDVRIFDFASAMPLDQEYWIGSIHFSATGEQVHASLIADYLVRSGLLPRQ